MILLIVALPSDKIDAASDEEDIDENTFIFNESGVCSAFVSLKLTSLNEHLPLRC